MPKSINSEYSTKILLLLLLIISYHQLAARTSSENLTYPVLKVAYLSDSSHSLDIQQVASPSYSRNFIDAPSQTLNFGFSSSTYWIRVSLTRADNIPELWYLAVGYPSLDTVQFYTSGQNNHWDLQQAGDKLLKNQSEIRYRKPLFQFSLPDTTQHVYYLKIRTQGTVQVPLKLYAQDELLPRLVQSELIEGLFYGAMLLMVLYNFFLFVALTERAYLYYCLFALGNIFAIAGLEGQLAFYLFPGSNWYDQLFISSFFAAIFWALTFTITFLDTRRFAPRMNRMLIGLAVITAIAFVSSYIIPYRMSATLVAILAMIAPTAAWGSGVLVWKQGNISARFFVIAWSLYLISVILIGLRNFGWISNQIHLEHIVQIGSALEALLLSFALADRINLYRNEKIKAQEQALKVSLENEQIIRNQNQVLEEQIKIRTQEVTTQNQELRYQQGTIEELNKQLISYSEDLEREVSSRTIELTNANKRLVQQNNRLEKFASVVSHKLRGPIARILGMVNILDNTNLTDHNKKCFTHLEMTAQGLDTVIKDLNQILIYRNSADYQLVQVPVRKNVETALNRLQEAITEENVQIYNSIPPQVTVYAIESYFQNVIQHLITNAIKYRSEAAPAEIHLTSKLRGNQLILSIADNGIGIDLEKHQDKIFGLYQRFHSHKEGRGIGLYLVKTQMETMGGHVEVNSTMGAGTVFKLYFNAQVPSEDLIYERSIET
ncbi:MAG: 7TM diverse intracellular signaling domain-containing protein [Bacteroidota bacterium]